MSIPTLLFKDVLHYTHDGYNPLASYKPYDFSNYTERELCMSLTYEEFKKFWHNERNSYQWNHFGERQSSFYGKMLQNEQFDDPLPTPEIQSRGRPRTYSWSIMHVCKRSRSPSALVLDRESVGQNCNVSIRIQKPLREDKVCITYFWKHNHPLVPNTRMPLGKNDINWMQQKVQQGHNLKSVKKLLKPSEKQLDSVSSK